MPLKRAQLAIFEASGKIFRTDRKTPTCLTTMRVWTFGRIESKRESGFAAEADRFALRAARRDSLDCAISASTRLR